MKPPSDCISALQRRSTKQSKAKGIFIHDYWACIALIVFGNTAILFSDAIS
jgi:hypothetical protein